MASAGYPRGIAGVARRDYPEGADGPSGSIHPRDCFF